MTMLRFIAGRERAAFDDFLRRTVVIIDGMRGAGEPRTPHKAGAADQYLYFACRPFSDVGRSLDRDNAILRFH